MKHSEETYANYAWMSVCVLTIILVLSAEIITIAILTAKPAAGSGMTGTTPLASGLKKTVRNFLSDFQEVMESTVLPSSPTAATIEEKSKGAEKTTSHEASEQSGSVANVSGGERLPSEIPALLNNPTSWPPSPHKIYPDMELYDQDGHKMRLSSLRGKVIVVQPVSMRCPLSQAYSGANDPDIKRFGDCFPQRGIDSFENRMRDYVGIDFRKPDLVFVQLLLFNERGAAPSLKDAKRWARHFDLRTSRDQYVLVAESSMVTERSKSLVPGFQLIDRAFILRSDSTGGFPFEGLYTDFFPKLKALFP